MAVTDLTGTKWRFNSGLIGYDDLGGNHRFSINFSSNNENFKLLYIYYGVPIYDDYGKLLGFSDSSISYDVDEVDSNEVYSYEYNGDGTFSFSWTNEAYRLIEITGGSDVTNATLISWLQSNATQIIDSPVLPSFSDVEVTPHEGYITMTINGVDFNLKTAASVSLISFGIDEGGFGVTTYQAEEGMTWGEWLASEYNTGGYGIFGTSVRNSFTQSFVGVVVCGYVDITDTITENYNYILFNPGACD